MFPVHVMSSGAWQVFDSPSVMLISASSSMEKNVIVGFAFCAIAVMHNINETKLFFFINCNSIASDTVPCKWEISNVKWLMILLTMEE